MFWVLAVDRVYWKLYISPIEKPEKFWVVGLAKVTVFFKTEL